LIRVEEALQRILSVISVLNEEEAPLLEAVGQVLSRDIHSTIDVPPADNSAMDGFAVQAGSTRGASPSSPRELKVIGQVAAGGLPAGPVGAGEAVRIMTGAPVPPGADTVVQFEDTDEEERRQAQHTSLSHIGIRREVSVGLNIRRAGEDIPRGSLVAARGTVLHPPQIGVLASLGMARVPVIRRPVVAIIGTGDELTPLGEPLPPGRIYDSNTYALAAQVQGLGGIPRMLGIARDVEADLQQKVRLAVEADLVLTSGGVSKGDYDMVKEVLAREGDMNFWTVKMKPGKPLAFGLFRHGERRVPHLGLPGNPVSSMITFAVFGRPAVLKMMGRGEAPLPTVEAVLEEPVTNRGGRRYYARVRLSRQNGQYYARLSGPQGSGILTSMSQADGLAVVPEDTTSLKAGDRVQVMLLEWSRERG
jgi:molybdopterin molybdotransferase